MSKRKLDESSPSSSSETQVNTRIIPLDISNSDRQVWLVKVPEVLAEIVNSDALRNEILGTIHVIDEQNSNNSSTKTMTTTNVNNSSSSSSSSSSSTTATSLSSTSSSKPITPVNRKRQRTHLSVQLDSTTIGNMLGKEIWDRTPQKYELDLDESNNTRIFSSSVGSGTFSTLGMTANYGTMKPDITDRSYTAYTQWRRNLGKERQASKPTTGSVDTETLTKNILRAKDEASLITTVIGVSKPSVSSTSMITSGNRITSVLEAFEKSAYWTVKTLAEVMNRKENEIRVDVIRYCDYLPGGSHARHYVLKPQYRTHRTPAPDADDNVHRVAATM